MYISLVLTKASPKAASAFLTWSNEVSKCWIEVAHCYMWSNMLTLTAATLGASTGLPVSIGGLTAPGYWSTRSNSSTGTFKATYTLLAQ